MNQSLETYLTPTLHWVLVPQLVVSQATLPPVPSLGSQHTWDLEDFFLFFWGKGRRACWLGDTVGLVDGAVKEWYMMAR